MGFSRKRIGLDGKPRYTAYYLDIRGQERSAGISPKKKAADKAWQDEEAKVRAGTRGTRPGTCPTRARRCCAGHCMRRPSAQPAGLPPTAATTPRSGPAA